MSELIEATDKSELERAEATFHDEWALTVDASKIDVKKYFESEACPENRLILQRAGELKGKRLLELGSGFGEAAVYFALLGAEVTATDISPEMLRVASQVAALNGVKLNTRCLSAMDLDVFDDNSFDMIYAANMLHHVDIALTMKEIYRKLKPGGRAFFIDPLAYNPVIYAYRLLATKYRTKDERPLNLSDIRKVCDTFDSVRKEYFWFTGLLVFLKFFLIDRLHPNDARYWKLIVDDSAKYSKFLKFAHKLDAALKKIPLLKLLCWNVVLICEKASS